MQEDIIRDWTGKVLGYITTDSQGDKIIKDPTRKILGFYDKSLNITKDYYGRPVARGDQSSLLFNYRRV